MQMGQPGADPILLDPCHGGTRGHKNLENNCSGLQVMPVLYSNCLFQRPTLGRTTLKNHDIRWSGNSMPGYTGRANLIPKEQALQPSLQRSLFKHPSQARGECIQGEMKLWQKVLQRDNAVSLGHKDNKLISTSAQGLANIGSYSIK